MKEISPQEIIYSINNVVLQGPPDWAYRLMGIGTLNIFKRTALRNSFNSLVFCLWQRSLREAHPESSERVLAVWKELMRDVYEEAPGQLESIARDIERYSSVMDRAGPDRFAHVALQLAVLVHGNRPENLAYAAHISVELEGLYERLLKLAMGYEIVDAN